MHLYLRAIMLMKIIINYTETHPEFRAIRVIGKKQFTFIFVVVIVV